MAKAFCLQKITEITYDWNRYIYYNKYYINKPIIYRKQMS